MTGIEASPMVFRRPLGGRALAAARLAWISIVVPTLALAVFGFVVGFADLTLLGPESIFVALAQASIDPAISVLVGLVLPLVLMTVIGAVMFWKSPADPMALLTSLMLITLTTAFSRSTSAAISTVPELGVTARGVFFVGFGSLVLVFALFPNGRSVPTMAWMSAPVLGLIVASLPGLTKVLATFPSRPAEVEEPTWLLDMMVVIAVSSFVVICQVYRYRTVSTNRERLQAKWVILPLGILFAQIFLLFVLAQPVFGLGDAFAGWAQLSVVPVSLMLPVGIAAAVLRYRLYDIERIVSRTVSYSLLTALLFGVFAALVFVLRELTPGQGDLAVAGSTLGVAALANPMRTRIQRAVDLRFNRAYTDTARTLSEITNTLRTTSDLDAVVAQLHSAVDRSFQPASLSVWVRSS
ncbi:MAG: hypothetical protein WD651_00230 [Acidimicrobiia bacterium]